MHLNNISIQGFKALRSFSADLNGNSLSLRGRNGAGKSSVIEAIYVALTQKEIPGVPVHREAVKASVKLGLSEGYTVTWTCTAGGTKSLKIENQDGLPFPKPAEFLRNLIGNITFDPFEFAEKTPAEQKKQLEDILGLDFSDLEAEKRKALDHKASVSRAKKFAEDELEKLADVTEAKEVDTTTLMAQREVLDGLRARRQQFTTRIAQLQEEEHTCLTGISDANEELERLRARALELKTKIIPGLEKDLEAKRTSIGAGGDALKALDEEIASFPDVDGALRNSGEINRKAAAWKRKVSLRESYAKAEVDAEAATMEIAEIEKRRVARIAEAQFPIEGLSFSDTGLLFNGLPFDEKSQSKSTIIKVGCAIAISQNPHLKLCRIKDGSLLDKASKEQILSLLAEHGFQTLIEEVDQEGGDLSAEIIEVPVMEEE